MKTWADVTVGRGDFIRIIKKYGDGAITFPIAVVLYKLRAKV